MGRFDEDAMLPRYLRLSFWLPPDVSTEGPSIDSLLALLHGFMLVLFVGWGLYLVYCLLRFRASRGGPGGGGDRAFRFPRYLELGIFFFEAALLVFLATPLWARIQNHFPDEKTALVVRVVAEQFAWNIHYPGPDGIFGRSGPERITGTNPLGLDRESPGAADDIVSVNDFHVPVHRPVIVHLSSKDVIHSFFLPVMRVKQDAIPGVEAKLWFEATRTGEFEIACAQLCGNGHFRMRGRLKVETPEAFAAWMEAKQKALHAR